MNEPELRTKVIFGIAWVVLVIYHIYIAYNGSCSLYLIIDKNLDTAHRSRSTPIRKQVQSSTPLERK